MLIRSYTTTELLWQLLLDIFLGPLNTWRWRHIISSKPLILWSSTCHIPEERKSEMSTLTILSKFIFPVLCMLILVHSQFQFKILPLFKVRYFIFVFSHYPDHANIRSVWVDATFVLCEGINRHDVHGSMHRDINLIERTNKTQSVVESIISMFRNCSTFFGRHTAHH
jgi:hypothetical protein